MSKLLFEDGTLSDPGADETMDFPAEGEFVRSMDATDAVHVTRNAWATRYVIPISVCGGSVLCACVFGVLYLSITLWLNHPLLFVALPLLILVLGVGGVVVAAATAVYVVAKRATGYTRLPTDEGIFE